MTFSKPSGFKEAVLLLVREKSSRYSLFREPFYLDRCVICTESEWAEYFEVHEIPTKDSFIFKVSDFAPFDEIDLTICFSCLRLKMTHARNIGTRSCSITLKEPVHGENVEPL